MKSHALFKDLLHEHNAKQVAGEMGLSTSIIYKWAQPSVEGGSGTVNPLDRVEQLMKLTDSQAIAQWICSQANGFFVKNPDADNKTARSVIVATNKVVQEFAEMLSLVATAAVDNSITDAESHEIRHRWESVKSATEDYVNCCQRGDFKELREHVKHPHKGSVE